LFFEVSIYARLSLSALSVRHYPTQLKLRSHSEVLIPPDTMHFRSHECKDSAPEEIEVSKYGCAALPQFEELLRTATFSRTSIQPIEPVDGTLNIATGLHCRSPPAHNESLGPMMHDDSKQYGGNGAFPSKNTDLLQPTRIAGLAYSSTARLLTHVHHPLDGIYAVLYH
jgi:hypothetical protein